MPTETAESTAPSQPAPAMMAVPAETNPLLGLASPNALLNAQDEGLRGDLVLEAPKLRDAHWPSELRLELSSGETLGKCLRAVWYSWMASPTVKPPSNNILKMVIGECAEDAVRKAHSHISATPHRKIRQKGYYKGLRYPVSLEIDDFVRIDGRYYGVEVKDKGGRSFVQQVFSKANPKPMEDNLMQCMLYLEHHRRHPLLSKGVPVQIAGTFLTYLHRDTCARKIFLISLDADGYAWIQPTGGHFYKECRFSVHDIIAGLQTIEATLQDRKNPPDREFMLAYSQETVLEAEKNTQIVSGRATPADPAKASLTKGHMEILSKWREMIAARDNTKPADKGKTEPIDPGKPWLKPAAYAKALQWNGAVPSLENSKRQPLGDWQCAYCSHVVTCWGAEAAKPFLPDRAEEEAENE